MREYRYITLADQKQIAAWCQADDYPADMAERLGMSSKAIYLELRRGEPGCWLNLAAGQAAEMETRVIGLDPAEAERPLTAEEKAELERSRPMFRFFVAGTPELTESEIADMDATEEKAVRRFLAKNNPEKQVIEINADHGVIQLHGLAAVEAFVQLIRDQCRAVYTSRQSRRGVEVHRTSWRPTLDEKTPRGKAATEQSADITKKPMIEFTRLSKNVKTGRTQKPSRS